jgi:hypothetical protein
MNYLFELNHKPEEHYMSKVIDRVASMRVISELNKKRAQCIKIIVGTLSSFATVVI